MRLLEIHVIQTVAPCNLNRDDTGSPKDAVFGGFRRARISSQAQKRAVRVAFKEWALFSPEELAVRTRRLVDALLHRLPNVPEQQARLAVENALNAMGFGVREGRTEYLLFLGNKELDNLARLIRENVDQLTTVSAKGKKQAEVNEELRKTLEKVLDGGKAVDLALFGRMLADRPERGMDAAAQVAHAISTHKVDREFDFYTAVDDLSPREETGAGMMGDVEFYSATLYRYALVNLDKLLENLQGDKELALRGALAFLEGFALVLPSGKQNSFAAHNMPLFLAFRAGEGLPRNLAAAFEKPVLPQENHSLSAASVKRLDEEWQKLDRAYGPLRRESKGALNLTEAHVELPTFGSLAELKREAEQALVALLEG